MAKLNLPATLYAERDEYERLDRIINKTSTGQLEFTSSTSGTTYRTIDYPSNPAIFNKGQEGLLTLFNLDAVLGNYKESAEDYNILVPLKLFNTTLSQATWVDNTGGSAGAWTYTLSNANILATSIVSGGGIQRASQDVANTAGMEDGVVTALGTLTFYAESQPTADIVVDLEVTL